MKRFTRSNHGAVAEINITPLLDLAWVLLVIFILITTTVMQGIEIQLPPSSPNETSLDETKVRTIKVQKSGAVYLDEERIDVKELETVLRNLKEAKGGFLPVVVRGDESTPYKYVVEVLDVLQKVPIQDLGLATKPISEFE